MDSQHSLCQRGVVWLVLITVETNSEQRFSDYSFIFFTTPNMYSDTSLYQIAQWHHPTQFLLFLINSLKVAMIVDVSISFNRNRTYHNLINENSKICLQKVPKLFKMPS